MSGFQTATGTPKLVQLPVRDREYRVERHDEQHGEPDDARRGEGDLEQPVRLLRAGLRRPAAYVLLTWSQACCHSAFVATGSCSSITPRRKYEGSTAVDIRLGGRICSLTRSCGVTPLSGCM